MRDQKMGSKLFPDKQGKGSKRKGKKESSKKNRRKSKQNLKKDW